MLEIEKIIGKIIKRKFDEIFRKLKKIYKIIAIKFWRKL